MLTPREKLELAMKLIDGLVIGPAQRRNPAHDMGPEAKWVEAKTAAGAPVYATYEVAIPIRSIRGLPSSSLQPELVQGPLQVEVSDGVIRTAMGAEVSAEVNEDVTKPETPPALAKKKCDCGPGHYCMRCS